MPDQLPIVDTHQHLWDLSKLTLPWQKNVPQLAKSFVMEDYLKATEGLGVEKSIYMEVDVQADQKLAEVEYVVDLCRSDETPMVAAVVGGFPADARFAEYVQAIRAYPQVLGVRQVLHEEAPTGFCLQPDFIRGVQLLGSSSLFFDLCVRKDELDDVCKLLDQCPNTKFILDHCGNADPQDSPQEMDNWKRGMAEVARRDNVVCKVSGIVVRAKPDAWSAADLAPIIHHTWEVFGPDRVMFGGDWPVCTLVASYRQWVTALREVIAERSEEDQRKLLAGNALRIYGLD